MFKDYVILNFDLGLKGDYESLYTFLDNHDALECGNGASVFKLSFPLDCKTHNEKGNYLKDKLEETVEFKKGDRVYVILYDNEDAPRGTFIYGHRQRPVWEGYGDKSDDSGLPF